MKQQKLLRKVLFHFVFIHMGLALFHLLSYQISHPLFKYLKSTPFMVQFGIVLLLNLLTYMIIGWVYAFFFKETARLNAIIEHVLIYFGLGFMLVYAIIYYASQTLYNPNIMLVYVIMNPWHGSYFIRMSEVDLYSLWWMLSALVPGLGLYLGVKIEYWMEKRGTE